MINNIEIIKKYYPFLDSMDEKQQQRMIEATRELKVNKGQIISSSREECLGVICIVKGETRSYFQSKEGREITLFHLHEGDICTLSASCVIDEVTFDIMMEASKDTTLYVTSVSFFKNIMKQNIHVENYVYKHTVERFSEVMWAMNQILFASFDKRLAGYLINEIKKSDDDTICVTHEEIAKDLGSAREVVSRMLKYFENEGLISLSRKAIKVINKTKLQNIKN